MYRLQKTGKGPFRRYNEMAPHNVNQEREVQERSPFRLQEDVPWQVPSSHLANHKKSNVTPRPQSQSISPDLITCTLPVHLAVYSSRGFPRCAMSEASSTSTTWKIPPGFTTSTQLLEFRPGEADGKGTEIGPSAAFVAMLT